MSWLGGAVVVDHGKGAQAISGQGQALVFEAQHDALVNQMLAGVIAKFGAFADEF